MKVLILGATGLVGHTLWREWALADDGTRSKNNRTILGTYATHPFPGMERLDILDFAALRRHLTSHRPEAVILAASNPYVDYCETHEAETRKINVDAVLETASVAREIGAKIVFFSSDYVFDGKKAPYREEDPVRPLNVYGRQKVEAERGIAGILGNHLILRISGVFGWELARKNFALQILDRRAEKGPILAATDVHYNPTYAYNIAMVLRELLDQDACGIFHVAGGQELSKYEFALEVAKTFGLDPARIRAVTQAELASKTLRPANSSLKSDKASAAVRAPLWGVAQALAHMKAHQPSPQPSPLRERAG